MTVWETTANDTNLDVLVELSGSHGKVLQMLDHLETREWHTSLVISVCQLFRHGFLGIGPGEDRRDDNKSLLLFLLFVQRFS